MLKPKQSQFRVRSKSYLDASICVDLQLLNTNPCPALLGLDVYGVVPLVVFKLFDESLVLILEVSDRLVLLLALFHHI